MSSPNEDDPLWQTAWQWVVQEHEMPLAPEQRAELVAWLKADARHRRHYDEALQLWSVASLVPTVHVDPDPEAPLDVEALRKIVLGEPNPPES